MGSQVTGYSHIIDTILKLSSDSGRQDPALTRMNKNEKFKHVLKRSLSMSWKSQVTTHQDEQ